MARVNLSNIWQKAGNHGLSKPNNTFTDKWRTLDLPHDFVIEGEFTSEASHSNGFLKGGKAWYVKKFRLPESARGRRIFIEFDGVYRDSEIHCNGHFIGRHLSGYTSFSYELTDVCNFGGMNAISVQGDATENELWSYEGGGIYRGVRLVMVIFESSLNQSVFNPDWCGLRLLRLGISRQGKKKKRCESGEVSCRHVHGCN